MTVRRSSCQARTKIKIRLPGPCEQLLRLTNHIKRHYLRNVVLVIVGRRANLANLINNVN